MVLEYPRYHTSMNTPVQSHTHLKKYFKQTKKTWISLTTEWLEYNTIIWHERIQWREHFLQYYSNSPIDWADAQADLSLRWAHMPFCWFCHEAAQMKPLKWMTNIKTGLQQSFEQNTAGSVFIELNINNACTKNGPHRINEPTWNGLG